MDLENVSPEAGQAPLENFARFFDP